MLGWCRRRRSAHPAVPMALGWLVEGVAVFGATIGTQWRPVNSQRVAAPPSSESAIAIGKLRYLWCRLLGCQRSPTARLHSAWRHNQEQFGMQRGAGCGAHLIAVRD
jgi:hypothetical protein